MRVAVSGLRGQLGSNILRQALGQSDKTRDISQKIEVLAVPRHLNLTDAQSVRGFFIANHIECLINCAAWTDVDGAEKDPEKTYLINALAPGVLARVARSAHIGFLHVSTEAVFSGASNSRYKEGEVPDPKSIYGKSKLAGEIAVQEENSDALIFRTSWLYSAGFETNFPTRLYKQLRAGNDEVRVVTDVVGNPTPARFLATALLASAVNRPQGGLYHVCTEGGVSKFKWAQHLAEIWGYPAGRIVPVQSSQFRTVAPRSTYVDLDTTKFQALALVEVPDWLSASNAYWSETRKPGKARD